MVVSQERTRIKIVGGWLPAVRRQGEALAWLGSRARWEERLSLLEEYLR
jgi:hypothetical protein